MLFAIPEVLEVIYAVHNFKDLSEDNDPYNEHDFGPFLCCGEKLFWKIDYYDSDLKFWSDPLSSDCHRVLNIMLTEDY